MAGRARRAVWPGVAASVARRPAFEQTRQSSAVKQLRQQPHACVGPWGRRGRRRPAAAEGAEARGVSGSAFAYLPKAYPGRKVAGRQAAARRPDHPRRRLTQPGVPVTRRASLPRFVPRALTCQGTRAAVRGLSRLVARPAADPDFWDANPERPQEYACDRAPAHRYRSASRPSGVSVGGASAIRGLPSWSREIWRRDRSRRRGALPRQGGAQVTIATDPSSRSWAAAVGGVA